MKKNSYVIKDKNSIFIDEDVVIGDNVIIYENNRLETGTIIEDNVTIYPNCFITNSVIKKGAKIFSSFIEQSEIGECSQIGNYSCIRRKTKIGANVKIGSFCEIKNSTIGCHVKIESYSKILNVEIKEKTIIGTGTIFIQPFEKCKRSFIGKESKIGSCCKVILPISIFDKTEIPSNSIVKNDKIDFNIDVN